MTSRAINPDLEVSLETQTMAFFLADLGWDEAEDVTDEFRAGRSSLGRESEEEVVLADRLRRKLRKLNPDAPIEALELAEFALLESRAAMSAVRANREVHDLLRDGYQATVMVGDRPEDVRVRFVDWEAPANNDWLLASQFWVRGQYGRKRMDLVGFVNGIPLLLIELKAGHRNVEHAFRDNLTDYKDTVPQLFWFNGFVVLSNGRESRVGTFTSPWEHFAEWKRVEREDEPADLSIKTLLRGTCERARLLDLIENFVVFSEERAAPVKILAKNHQVLGVNNAIDALHAVRGTPGKKKLGVYWHTQGSGKSYSMVFYSRKVLRKVPGNWTFVVVTDRVELDDQIYGTFQRTGTVTRENVQADSGDDLKALLKEENRFVFTLIQKFRTEGGREYPMLSERDDVIVMVDEAHRSQYDIFATNMRSALPNAAFLAFTGTPLLVGEERTREEFGDYVSIYNFSAAIQDNATVPLFYENRKPEVEVTNAALNDDMDRLLEDASLGEAEEAKIEREFAREYHLITRSDRLDTIAEDLVEHFMTRGFNGKAMFVAIDKATAVKVFDRVQREWERYKAKLEAELVTAANPQRESLARKLAFMDETDMAVVVSQEQGEIAKFDAMGLDIREHRRRMVAEDLDEDFKNPEHPLRIVFVCAMWMTGFDAPATSTIYLDKPMKNHTLMQTIARANRVFGEKAGGQIVDYIGVFRNLQEALAIYGTRRDDDGGDAGSGEMPIKAKEELLAEVAAKVEEIGAFLAQHGVDPDPIVATTDAFERVELLGDAQEKLLVSDEVKRAYLTLARRLDRLYRATLPADEASAFAPFRKMAVTLQRYIESTMPEPDISNVLHEVETLLDDSIDTQRRVLGGEQVTDLSQFDFEALKSQYDDGKKRTAADRLRGVLNAKARDMVRKNRERIDFLEQLEKLVEAYNAASYNVEEFFRRLMELKEHLEVEDQRAAREDLTEEQLAVFDLLLKPGEGLDAKRRAAVKRLARELVEALEPKLVLDWRKSQQTVADVKITIEDTLDRLPYDDEIWEGVFTSVFEHVRSKYEGAGHSVYVRQGSTAP